MKEIEKLSFSINDTRVINENPNSNFAILAIDFFASGDNLHNMYVSEETLLRTSEGIKNCPIVWKYNKNLDDIGGHERDEVPCGFVPETATVESRRLEDGRVMLSVMGYIWKRYTGAIVNIFKRDGGVKPVSVEMRVSNSKELPDGRRELLDFKYECITALGSFLTPAIPMARGKMLSFADIKDEYVQEVESQTINEDVLPLSTNLERTEKTKDMGELEKDETIVSPPVEVIPEEVIQEESQTTFESTPEEKPEEVKTTEEMAKEQKEEETLKTPEKEEKEEKEKEEEEEEKEKKFAFPQDFNVEKMEEFFSEESDDEKIKMASLELKKGELADPSVLISGMFAKLCKMSEANKVYMQENESLKKFKEQIDNEKKSFEVDSTIRTLSEKVVIPAEIAEEMRTEAEKYAFDNLEAWKTQCKARSFDFAAKTSDASVVKVGMPFTATTSKKKDDLWAS